MAQMSSLVVILVSTIPMYHFCARAERDTRILRDTMCKTTCKPEKKHTDMQLSSHREPQPMVPVG
jgi:hypothetical protein